ncbi:TPA: hypothetical protein DIV48_03395 [Candidatus Kaiserbacteria bacterium]|nr:MAG: hypothetical protein UY93_C0003G0054 [Parcubacteria group bacterium GW2011_GWA1_56_13]KKW45816.1 MAG: hypothetical protein UY97_C0014G0014 [Parcubacteria group bacterium GW2011_GWB1_57_6]HCR52657.1 hypothetical protein [Candidatus Kaiserbacteria bacterium]
MNLTKFIPVSLMVAAFAAAWVLIGQYYNLALWVPFISWPLYFVYDPDATKLKRIPKEIVGLLGGIVFGYVTLWLAPQIGNVSGATWALPLTVFLVAFTIVMLELTNLFELAPAYFFSYAGYFAYVFGGFAGAYSLGTAFQAMLPYGALILVGLAIGLVTAYLRRIILQAEGLYGFAQRTVFDKEI